jgi:hypothetical protein
MSMWGVGPPATGSRTRPGYSQPAPSGMRAALSDLIVEDGFNRRASKAPSVRREHPCQPAGYTQPGCVRPLTPPDSCAAASVISSSLYSSSRTDDPFDTRPPCSFLASSPDYVTYSSGPSPTECKPGVADAALAIIREQRIGRTTHRAINAFARHLWRSGQLSGLAPPVTSDAHREPLVRGRRREPDASTITQGRKTLGEVRVDLAGRLPGARGAQSWKRTCVLRHPLRLWLANISERILLRVRSARNVRG